MVCSCILISIGTGLVKIIISPKKENFSRHLWFSQFDVSDLLILKFKLRKTMRTRLPQYHVQCTPVNQQHFGRKIIVLVQVLAKIPQIQKQVIKCQKFLLSFCDQERSLPRSTSITVLTFLVKKKKENWLRVYSF